MAAGPLLVSEPGCSAIAHLMAGDPVWRHRPIAHGHSRAPCRRHAGICWAIPEADPTGRRIDWYAPPFDGIGTQARRSRRDGTHRRARRGCAAEDGDMTGLVDSMEVPARSSAERNFRAPAAPCLTAPGGHALRRRQQAGHDVLGLQRGRSASNSWPVHPSRLGPYRTQTSPEAVPGAHPPLAAVALRSTWWQWLLLCRCCFSCWRWLPGAYPPQLEPVRGRGRASGRSACRSASRSELPEGPRRHLQRNDSEALPRVLARLTDELARRGGDSAAGPLPGGGVIASNAPIERGALPDAPTLPVSTNCRRRARVRMVAMQQGDTDQTLGPDDKGQRQE